MYTNKQGPIGASLCLNGTDWYLRQVENGLGRTVAALVHLPNEFACELESPNSWVLCSVPGSVQTALMQTEAVASPWYYAGNILDLVKATLDKDSLFRKVFTVPAEWAGRVVRLYFGAVDYDATFFINGQEVGRHEGHFSRILLEVSGALLYGEENVLTVVLGPFPRSLAPCGPRRNQTARPQILKNILSDCTPPSCPLGISDDVFILASDRLAIDDFSVHVHLNDDFSEAIIEAFLTFDSRTEAQVEILYDIRTKDFHGHPQEIRRSLTLSRGKQTVRSAMAIHSPRLWWPHGHGGQNLYVAQVSLTDKCGKMLDAAQTVFGVRRVELKRNPDSENVWLFVINGKAIFLKGSNWVPLDPFYRATREMYDRLLRQALSANINTLRWWGGGVPERPAFYELCDEYGILVYHDFFLANDDFDNVQMLSLLDTQATDFVRRLRNHPCLVAWNGGNEWFTPKANGLLEIVVNREDPTRTYFRPCGQNPGEIHGPYHYDPNTHYERLNGFSFQAYTEFGCAAMGNLETLYQIIPHYEIEAFDPLIASQTHPGTDLPGDQVVFDCPLASWRFHNSFWLQPGILDSVFGQIHDLAIYVAASQFLGGEGLRYTIEELRRKMFCSSVALVWQFNETWPNAAGNATVDWFGRPRVTHFYVAKAYEPVHVSLRYDRINWRCGDTFQAEVWGTSDLSVALPHCEVRWDICDASGAKVVGDITMIFLPANTSLKVSDITWSIPTDYDSFFVVYCRVRDLSTGEVMSQNHYVHSAHSSTPHFFMPLLQSPGTSLMLSLLNQQLDCAEFVVKNTGSHNALFCLLELAVPDDTGVTYSDNAFCLAPGDERRVYVAVWSPKSSGWRPDFRTITCQAWNSPREVVTGKGLGMGK